MKVCIIGASGHYGYALEGMHKRDGIQLAGIAPGSKDERIGELDRAVQAFQPSVSQYEDYRIMLDELKPNIVVINSYFNDNANITIEALERGIHVFVEKPVATTYEDLERVEDTYRKSGVHLATMLGLRYERHFFTAWKKIQEGGIGEVRLMNAQKSYKLGKRSRFYTKRETYGGTIPWVGSHAIDWMHWMGGQKFQSVFASHSTLYNQEHGDLEASALCHFTFSNQVFGSVNIDYFRPEQAPSHDDDRIRIAGTRGVIEVRGQKVYLINDEIEGVQELPLLSGGQIFDDFIGHVREEKKSLLSAEDSFLVTRACLKARESADSQMVVYF